MKQDFVHFLLSLYCSVLKPSFYLYDNLKCERSTLRSAVDAVVAGMQKNISPVVLDISEA